MLETVIKADSLVEKYGKYPAVDGGIRIISKEKIIAEGTPEDLINLVGLLPDDISIMVSYRIAAALTSIIDAREKPIVSSHATRAIPTSDDYV